MLGYFGTALHTLDISSLLETIDPHSSSILKSAETPDGIIAVSYPQAAPLRGNRLFEEPDDLVAISGDLIGTSEIPWKQILSSFKNKRFAEFDRYRGRYALAHYDRRNKSLTLVSDRRGQQPLYYGWAESSFTFSTELSTFCRLNEPAELDENWLFDYFFFNYPVGGTTALKGVYKVPPASVISVSLPASRPSSSRYAESFQEKPELLSAPRSFELAARLFQEKIPPYFLGADAVACALTAGWDGRTLLAHAPDKAKVVTYTYGVRGCQDIQEAARTARKLGVRHQEIHFDQDFVARLPDYMVDTVFLSSGSEKVLRSSLLHVYRQLTASGKLFPLVISGIGMDGIFRGHAQAPAIVSADIAELFRTGQIRLREPFWPEIFPDRYPLFRENILRKLEALRRDFGDFRSPKHHLLFKLYVTHPELFGGELKIAEGFTTVRVPAWDDDLIDLAFSIRESGLSYSEFCGHERGDVSELRLQAFILNRCFPAMARIPVGRIRPDLVGLGTIPRLAYEAYRKMVNKLGSLTSPYSPLEDWEKWLNEIHRDFIDELVFSPRSLIQAYVGREFIEKIRRSREIHWLGKLATAEIMLRLIRNRWRKSP